MKAEIFNKSGERLDYTFQAGSQQDQQTDWIFLVGHGLTGDKNRPISVELCQSLNAVGMDTLRFSFAGNGESEGAFKEATITKEAADLEAIIDAVAGSYTHIGYVGHSMGGAVGVLQAGRDPRIKALVSVAGMIHTKKFAETEFSDVTPDEGVMWEEPEYPLSQAFIDDLCHTHASFPERIEKVNTPWLLVHGSDDDIVLPLDSELVEEKKKDEVTYIPIKGANHVFDTPEQMSALSSAVASWAKGLPKA